MIYINGTKASEADIKRLLKDLKNGKQRATAHTTKNGNRENMNINMKNIENLKEKRELNGITIKDLREYGYCFLEEIYHNEIGEEIKVEIYELDCKTYLIRCVNDRCVIFRDITARKD